MYSSDPESLHPAHYADLKKYPVTDETIAAQRIRSIPPNMITTLLRFNPERVTSAMLIPFADPAGGWMDHVRMKVFPAIEKETGRGKAKKVRSVKYLQPKASGSRLFFPVATMRAACDSLDPLYVIEGEKKALLFAQTGYPTVGICGVENWHVADSDALLPDFDYIHLDGRVVNVCPDGDFDENDNVERAIYQLGLALEHRGARPELLRLHQPSRQETTAP